MTPRWLVRAWEEALEEEAERSLSKRQLPFNRQVRGMRQPSGGLWLIDLQQLKSKLPPTPSFRYGAFALIAAVIALLIPAHLLFLPFAFGVTSQLINLDVPDSRLGD